MSGLRLPTTNLGPLSSATRELVYDPDLSPAEQAIYDRLVRVVRSPVSITPAEWEAIESDIAAYRTFRQMTPAAFGALTAAQRDTELFQCAPQPR